MSAYEQRRNPGQIFLRRIGLFALFCIVLGAAFGVWNVYRKERESAMLRTQAEHERMDLALRETQLKDDITKLKTDRGLEEALREQYALAEDGEGVIIIVEPPAPAPVQASSSVMGWFKEIFRWW